MPLRRPLALMTLTVSALLHPATGFGADDQDLNWLDRTQWQQLPAGQRPELPDWCPGLWYNPAFSQPPATNDTVITAAESELRESGLMALSGDVEIRQPGRILRAGRATVDQSSGDFVLEDGIRVETPTVTFEADSLTGNTRTGAADLLRARYALFDMHAHGGAGAIEQRGAITRIEDGSYTTCPPGDSAWLLQADDIELDRDTGWGEARDVVLRVRKVPVAYIPWITFPIDDRRKTGLLFPTISSSSEGGVDISQPLYLNLHPQFDLTLAPRHIHGRGNGLETEGRYLTGLGEGEISYGYLANDRAFAEDRLLENNGDPTEEKPDREVARWRHSGQVQRWALDADVNYVSDDYYFKDLDTGLDIAAQTNLVRSGRAEYFGRQWRGLVFGQSWQTIDPTLDEEDYPYRRLPQLALEGDPTLAGPLHLLWLSDFTRYRRNVDIAVDDITGDRAHLAPGLGLRLENDWGYFKPEMRYYYTHYDLEGVDTLPDDNPSRSLSGASVDAGLFLERTASRDGRWLQTLEPRLFANYMETELQQDLPDFGSAEVNRSYESLFRENRFLGYDRIADDHSITPGLTTRFIDGSSGEEVLRLRTAQRQYLQERYVQIDGDARDDSPRSPLITDALVRLNGQWDFFVENQWDSETNQRLQNQVRISYADSARRYLHAGFIEQLDDRTRQAELAGYLPVSSHWRLIGRWLYDVENERSLETIAGVEYRDCCWRVRMVSQRDLAERDGDNDLEAESRFLVQIQLIGLGGFGGTVDSLLERSIPGYRSDND